MPTAHSTIDTRVLPTATASSSVNEHGDYVALTHEPINEQSCIDHVKDVGAGAVCSFCGTTRNHFAGRQVTRLEYEAYESMALRSLLEVIAEARHLALQGGFSTDSLSARLELASDDHRQSHARGLIRICIVHRLGLVPPLQTSIVIAVSSAHRRESFAACEWILEAVKRRVPIWKREWYENEATSTQDGAAQWKANFSPEIARSLN